MADHEYAALVYARLARVSHERQQFSPRDKFLIQTGAAACRAAWLDVAARCRALVLEHNPVHALGHHATLPDALRSPDFAPLLKRLERFCPLERAEALLKGVGIEVDPDQTPRSADEVLRILQWPDPDQAAE